MLLRVSLGGLHKQKVEMSCIELVALDQLLAVQCGMCVRSLLVLRRLSLENLHKTERWLGCIELIALLQSAERVCAQPPCAAPAQPWGPAQDSN